MAKFATWLDEIVAAYEALGNIAPYDALYNYIEKTTDRDLTTEWKATVRRTIENYSADSQNYLKGANVFFSEKGLGRGIWGLQDKKPKTEIVADLHEPEQPKKMEIVTSRIIRDTKVIRHLKMLYEHRCQICNQRITLPARYYSEGHHIQPLGAPHVGPDAAENIMIVCPQHHAEFDLGVLAIHPTELRVMHFDQQNSLNGKGIYCAAIHKLGEKYLEYHLKNIYIGKH